MFVAAGADKLEHGAGGAAVFAVGLRDKERDGEADDREREAGLADGLAGDVEGVERLEVGRVEFEPEQHPRQGEGRDIA